MAIMKNLIFDFGNVLVDLDRQATVEAFHNLGIDIQHHMHNYKEKGPFYCLETGECTVAEFCHALRQWSNLPQLPTDAQIIEAWNRMLVRIPERRLLALEQLRKHFRIFLLSNTNSIHWNHSLAYLFNRQGKCAEDYFDRIFLSYEMRMMKPDTEIFNTVLREADIKPEETLFIDDAEANCQGAANLGIRTFCPAEADDWLPLFIS